jgi:hypothetical protein
MRLIVPLLVASPALADVVGFDWKDIQPQSAFATYEVITYPNSSLPAWQGLTSGGSQIHFNWTVDLGPLSIPAGSTINDISLWASGNATLAQNRTVISSTPVDPSSPFTPTLFGHWDAEEFPGFTITNLSVGGADIPLNFFVSGFHSADAFNLTNLGLSVPGGRGATLSGYVDTPIFNQCCTFTAGVDHGEYGYNSDTVALIETYYVFNQMGQVRLAQIDYVPTPEPSSILLLIIPAAVFLIRYGGMSPVLQSDSLSGTQRRIDRLIRNRINAGMAGCPRRAESTAPERG